MKKKKEGDMAIDLNAMSEKFEEFWKMYGGDKHKREAMAAWGDLPVEDWQRVIDSVITYLSQTSRLPRSYRLDADEYIRSRAFDYVFESVKKREKTGK